MSLYAGPRLGRAGLGNILFPWARAELFARSTGIRIVAPDWGTLRVGPYLRREPDKRRYGSFFTCTDHVHGMRRFVLDKFATPLLEGQPECVYDAAKCSARPHVVVFSGIGELFSPLLSEHEYVRQRLWDMTRIQLRPGAGAKGPQFIAMHVRRGDITRQGFTESDLAVSNQYTPLDWFVEMAVAMRRESTTAEMPIVVYSDGSADELSALLKVSGVQMAQRQPAIVDLWSMSQASLLFASGYSTFSMWASYLGGMPSVYAPGKRQQFVQAGRAGAVEVEVAAGDVIPDCVTAHRRLALGSSESWS